MNQDSKETKSEQKRVIVKEQIFITSRLDSLNNHRVSYRAAVFIRPLEAILPNNSYASHLFPINQVRKNNQVILEC